MTLLHRPTQQKVAGKVNFANSFSQRLFGLIGTRLEKHEALCIDKCNSIHTFFMGYSLDLIFVDQNYKIRKVIRNLGPWKIVLPITGAKKVFELNAGAAQEWLKEGDQLELVNTNVAS